MSRIFMLVAMFLMALTLAACGGSQDQETTPAVEPTPVVEPAPVEPAPVEPAPVEPAPVEPAPAATPAS